MIRPAWVAAILIVPFYLADGSFREGKAARRAGWDRVDAGTSLVLLAACLVCFTALLTASSALWADVLPGLVPMTGGAALRIWAMRVLGRFYTRTLMVQPEQRVVREGPYRYVRHPGYCGMILLWSGAAVCSGQASIFFLVTSLLLGVYAWRIVREERILAASLPAYQEYRRTTAAVVPCVW